MRTFIFGTDWWDDCDDAVALRILARAHKSNEIRLGGVVINAVSEWSVPSVDGFMTLEGVTDVPVGLDFAAIDYPGELRYQQRLCAFASRYKTNSSAEEAVRLYRRVLAEATQEVVIVEVGFLQALAGLIESKADDISPLDGIELLKQKCSKVYSMAGKWDEDGADENNIRKTERSRLGASTVFEKCPVPLCLLGYEVGYGVISGSKLAENDFLHTVLSDHGSADGRHSWDPLTAHLALVGDAERAGYSCVCGRASVDVNTGKNFFVPDENAAHSYVVKQKPDEYYAAQLDEHIKTEEVL